jgi:hypothetical protein
MSAVQDMAGGADGALPGRIERRPTLGQSASWLREIARAWQSMGHGGMPGDAGREVPAEAGPHASRAGTTRYSAPAHALLPSLSGVVDEITAPSDAALPRLQPPTLAGTPQESVALHADGAAAYSRQAVQDSFGERSWPAMTPKAIPSRRAAAPTSQTPATEAQGAILIKHADTDRQVGAVEGNAATVGPAASASALDRLASTSGVRATATDEASVFTSATVAESAGTTGGAPHRPMPMALSMGDNPSLGFGLDAIGAGRAAAISSAGMPPNGVAASALASLQAEPLEQLAGPVEEAAEATAWAVQPEAGDDYAGKHVHVCLGEDGVHAFVRDAGLEGADVLAIAQAIYEQGLFGQASLASLTVNGIPVPRSAQRGARTSARTVVDGVKAEPDAITVIQPFEQAGAWNHDHQRR